jgi:hypothetical protein
MPAVGNDGRLIFCYAPVDRVLSDRAEEPDHERVAAVEAQTRGLDLGLSRNGGRRPARRSRSMHAFYAHTFDPREKYGLKPESHSANTQPVCVTAEKPIPHRGHV